MIILYLKKNNITFNTLRIWLGNIFSRQSRLAKSCFLAGRSILISIKLQKLLNYQVRFAENTYSTTLFITISSVSLNSNISCI